MDDQPWGEIIFGVALVALMATLTFMSHLARDVGRAPVRGGEERAERGARKRTVRGLIEPQRSWFAAVEMMIAASLVVGVTLLTTALGDGLGSGGAVVAILIVLLVYLVFGQGLPPAVSFSRPQWSSKFVATIGGITGTMLRPVGMAIEAVAHGLNRVVSDAEGQGATSGREDDLRGIISHDDDGVIEADERDMIDGVLHLEEVRVRDIMVPRVDIVAIERTTSARDIVDTIIRAGHSRIPVYQLSIDRIIGVLYAKDLLPFVMGATEALPLVSMLRPAYVVPESKRVDDLLDEMRQAKIHLAIVADEYGGTAGIVTIEDILEEIVGEIQDEYDKELPLFEVVGKSELLADGRLAVEDVEDTLDVQFEDDDYGTLAGFVQKHLGRLPQEGDTLVAEGVGVEIIEVERHRVRRMRVWRVDNDADSAGPVQVERNDEERALPATAGDDESTAGHG